jgi:hypothetical protein
MFKRSLSVLILIILGSGVTAAFGQTATSAPPAGQTPKPPKPVSPPPKTEKTSPTTPAPRAPIEEQEKIDPVNVKLGRGGKVAISIRSGQIFVSGWDRDIVQASAAGESGAVPIETQTTGDPSRPRLLLTVAGRRYGRDARLDVKVPRYADVETLEFNRGEIDVADVEGATLINLGNGDVKVMRVGSLKVSRRSGDVTVGEVKGDVIARSYNGDINVSSITGLVDISATNGDLNIHNAGGDVRANSLTGDVNVRCAKGRADVSSASGSISLIGIGGDVEASTASGDVTFVAPIRAGGSYRLKSLSGGVSMTIQPDVAGFTASLTTYSGGIDTGFPLKVETPGQGGPLNRRINGVFGNGQAKLSLDSFSGTVTIAKGTAAALKECK